ncbi:restriction endonuclease subunit S [Paraburkholderia azotifigens]|uniref:Restriction endonuclease subunit S n=1 Tax=Paraburkholderia azotifigens TaxID=2057004 RepID=A0A5C6VSB7_9BURK|nr:restriction endonuclease subunit S [Paraburkholderia azotifigens]TXC88067.1 restriction endonuclease subunit S [Paraburkholderia azotifigens]
MSLPAYNLYRESGIDWVDRVPQHWQIASLKWLSTRYSGGTPDKNRLDYWEDGTIPWLNSGAVNSPIIEEPSAYITEEAFANSSAKWVPQNALVMALAGQGKTKGMVAQVSFPTTCNQSMAALIPNERLAARYLYWWLVSNYQNIRNMAGGDLRDGLNLELLGSISCPLPSPEEQGTIAAFLDRETSKIDTLIAEQEKLLELLAEKRQATISRAVTRGLNPDVPMKDSGVEWLGEVPIHWGIGALGYLCSIETGATPDRGEPRFWNGSIPWLKTGEINWAPISESEEFISEEGLANSATKLAKPGTLLMAMYGQGVTRGRVALLEIEAAYNQACAAMSFGPRVLPSFARYFFMAAYDHVRDSGNETSQMNLSVGLIAKFKMTIPPTKEQAGIVSWLDSEVVKLDSLDVEAKCAIALLKERRSALISAAVTGKIDVRERSSAMAAAA